MANLAGYLVDGGAGQVLPSAEKERVVALPAQFNSLSNGATPAIRYFKMQAPCTSSPSGYITWQNTTGDDAGRPTCGGTLGASFIADSWVVQADLT